MSGNDGNKKQCFTSIQSRKLLGGMDSCQLCPSMDLIVFGSSASQQSLYRTVSWQKVATINQDTTASSLESDAPDTATVPTTTCWSPDGRWIVVANDSQVSLYGVEPLANPPGGATFTNSGPTEAQHSWKVSHPVIGLSWAHVGRPHPTAWTPSTDEIEENVYWSYQSQYVDKAIDFLPPSSYHHNAGEEDDHQHHHEATTTTALPECKTPLSILCVSTTNELELYLHGRYPILKLPRMQSKIAFPPPKVVASHDLTHLVVYSEPRVSFYHLPFLKHDRYPLQTIASLHSSIVSHLSMLQQSIPEVLNAWKSSLKPLDTKLQPLQRLLRNYGVDDQPLGSVLKQYILVGHTSDSSSVANAMDQFFTSVQMNDQLLQRMERSLHGSLANVESQARKSLLSPTQALVFQIQELSGFIQFHKNNDKDSSALQELVDASQFLWVCVESILKSIVESRFKVRDFCGYLRHAGSQIKAKGTAPQSVQRENAKKRRVPQAVLGRLLSYLNADAIGESEKQGSLSEHLLSINVLALLKDTPNVVLNSNHSNANRPSSPSSVIGFSKNTPTLGFAASQTLEASKKVFVNPLANVPPSIVPEDVILPQFEDSNPSPVVIHTRVGREPVTDDIWEQEDNEEEIRTYFLPRVAKHSYTYLPDCLDCRQWSVIAQAHGNIIQLYCIPLGWKDPKTFHNEVNEMVEEVSQSYLPFYLTTKLVLPTGSVVKDLGFYSDDGKSSLSSGSDSGTGKEGRQKLGILVEDTEKLDLWLVKYDNVLWQLSPFESILVHPSEVDEECTCNIVACPEGYDEDEEGQLDGDDSVLVAQTRTVARESFTDSTSKLWLSGSRGVGGIALTAQGITSLEILDLEEDEFDDDEEDDEEDEEEFDEE